MRSSNSRNQRQNRSNIHNKPPLLMLQRREAQHKSSNWNKQVRSLVRVLARKDCNRKQYAYTYGIREEFGNSVADVVVPGKNTPFCRLVLEDIEEEGGEFWPSEAVLLEDGCGEG